MGPVGEAREAVKFGVATGVHESADGVVALFLETGEEGSYTIDGDGLVERHGDLLKWELGGGRVDSV